MFGTNQYLRHHPVGHPFERDATEAGVRQAVRDGGRRGGSPRRRSRRPTAWPAAVDLRRRADSARSAVVHHRHHVAEHERLLLVVGDEHRRDPGLGQQPVHIGADLRPAAWCRGSRTARRAAAPRGAGRGRGRGRPVAAVRPTACPEGARPPAEADHVEHLVDRARPPLAPGQPVGDVLGDGQMGEQRPVLEHHPDPAVLGGTTHVRSSLTRPPTHDQPCVGPLETGDGAQQRGLAAATRAEQSAHCRGVDRQRHPAQDSRVSEPLLDAGDRER